MFWNTLFSFLKPHRITVVPNTATQHTGCTAPFLHFSSSSPSLSSSSPASGSSAARPLRLDQLLRCWVIHSRCSTESRMLKRSSSPTELVILDPPLNRTIDM